MTTQVLGSYSFATAPDVNGNLLLTTSTISSTLAAPGPIGATTPSTGAFTTLSTTGNIQCGGSLTTVANVSITGYLLTANPIVPYCDCTGTSDALVGSFLPPITALVDGLLLNFSPVGQNVTTTPTLNVNGLGARTIARLNNIPLAINDINGASAQCSVTYNASTNTFILMNPTSAGSLNAIPGTIDMAPIVLAAGPVMTTATAGAFEYDGTSYYKTVDTTNGRRTVDGWNYFRLTGSGTGITGGIGDFFGNNSAIPLVAGGIYEIEWCCYYTQSGGASTATWTVTSTNALQSLTGEYIGSPIAGIGAVGTPQTAGVNVTASTATAFPVTGTEANATHRFIIHVTLQANATTGGNTRLRLTPGGGTATPLINSRFRVRRLPAGNTGKFVA